MSTTSRKDSDEWHRKIANNRGASWKKNMLAGRRDALLNPSNIRLVRLRKNILQAAIAKKLEISESTYGAIERGKRLVRKDVVDQISTHLGISAARLFKSAGKKKFVAIIAQQAI